jgi:CDP-paratose synthetase
MLFLLTGATGFLGSHLVKALLERGHSVAAYRRPSSNDWRLGALSLQVQWHELPAALSLPFHAARLPDAVIHCAALYGRRGELLIELIDANTRLPVQLYQLAAAHRVSAFINTDTILAPGLNPYALSKHHAADWLRLSPGPTRVLNLKVQHFYGPLDDPTKFITWLVQQCLAHAPEINLTDGRQWRDFIYVADVVHAMVTLAERANAGGENPRFEEYELGTGQPVQLRQLVERIRDLTGSRSQLRFGAMPHRPGEPMRTEANIAQLTALGWRPEVSLEAGLKQTIQAERTRIQTL